MSAFRYRPEVDGLRAFAILPVVLFHLKPELLPGGYAGVDVFFVISGFLITSIILKEQAEGRFTFKAFWLRRVRRILPALLAMLLGTALINQALLIGIEKNDLGLHGVAALFSVANFSLWLSTGSYWGAGAESQPLLHVWSLSVEEQFYLLFPILITLALTRARRVVAWLLAGAIVASFALYLFESRYHPDRAFYLLPSRVWELGCGCLAAVLAKEGLFAKLEKHWIGGLLAAAGLVAIVASSVLLSGKGGVAGQLALPVLGCVAVILFCHHPASPAYRVLTLWPVVYCGKISYSLYLWHWPLLLAWKLAEQRLLVEIPPAVYVVATAGASVLSYHFIETPARQHPRALGVIAVGFAAMLAGYAWLWGVDHYYDVSRFAPIRSTTRVYDAIPGLEDWHFDPRDHRIFVGVEVDTSLRPAPDAYLTGGLIRRHGGDVPSIVVLGDSHALMWGSAIDEAARELGRTVAFYTASGVRPYVPLPPTLQTAGNPIMSPEDALVWEQKKLHYIAEWKPDVVIMSCRWSRAGSEAALKAYLRELRQHAGAVLLIEQPPELYFGQVNAAQFLGYLGQGPLPAGQRFYLPPLGAVEPEQDLKYKKGREMLRKVSAPQRGIVALKTYDVFANEAGEGWVLDGNRVLYLDDDHLAYDGGMLIKDRLRDAIVFLTRRGARRGGQDAGESALRASSSNGVDK